MIPALMVLLLVAQAHAYTDAVPPAPMTASSNGWGNHTARFVIRGPRVIASGSTARITLKAGVEGFTATAYIGHGPPAPAHPWDFEAPVPLSLGGAYTIVCPPWGSVICDPVALRVTAGRDLVVSVAFSGAGSVARDNGIDASSYALYFRQGVSEAAAPAPSGYSTGTPDRELVVSVEVAAPAADAEPDAPREILSAATLRRPTSYDCLAGPAPAIPTHTPYAFWTTSVAVHERRQIPLYHLGGSVPVFGDSGLEACVVSSWSPWCENYSINSETIAGLLNRLPRYISLHRARAVVACIGVNDIGVDAPDMPRIQSEALAVLNWLSGPLVWIAVTPTTNPAWNANIRAFNAHVHAALANRANCVRVDIDALLADGAGLLRDDCRIDQEHLNAKGQAILARAVRDALRRLP